MTKGIDLYTKIVLTVIAVCLVYIVTKDVNIVPEAQAKSSTLGKAEKAAIEERTVSRYDCFVTGNNQEACLWKVVPGENGRLIFIDRAQAE